MPLPFDRARTVARRVFAVARKVITVARKDQVTFLAASIAFYAFLSVFPLLLLLLVVGTSVGGPVVTEAILDVVTELLAPNAQAIFTEALVEETGRSGAGLVGVLFLVWSASRVFRGLAIAFGMIYDTDVALSFRTTVVNGITVLGAMGIALAAIFLLRASLVILAIPPLWQHLSVVPLFIGLLMLFFPMYYLFPRQYHGARGALPGTTFAAAGWALLGEVFALYAANARTFALFGVIGGVLLVLTWFYFGAVVILTGAILNAVLAGREVGVPVGSASGSDWAEDPEG